jgi:hypothetical protein
MIILTSETAGTYKAQIRSDLATGFKQLYTATSTSSELFAARAVVRKWFSEAAADSVQRVKDGDEIKRLTGDFFQDAKRKQVFEVYSFDPKAKETTKPKLPIEILADKTAAERKALDYTDAQKSEVVRFVNEYNTDHGQGGQAAASKHFNVPPLSITAWLKKSQSSNPPANVVTKKEFLAIATEIMAGPKTVLSEAAKALETLEAQRKEQEFLYNLSTLPIHLKEGLHCLKAHCALAIKDPGKRNKSGRNQATSRRDVASAQGFEGWLETSCPWLKKGAAYKYMTALKGLGLSELNTEEDVDTAVAQNLRIGQVTLKSLCDASLEPFKPATEEETTITQTEFDFLKQTLSGFRKEGDALLANKAQLDSHPEFKRAAMARAYQILHDLSGTDWKPSNEPDALASVDPDTFTL